MFEPEEVLMTKGVGEAPCAQELTVFTDQSRLPDRQIWVSQTYSLTAEGMFHVGTVLPSPAACGHVSVCMANICLGSLAATLPRRLNSTICTGTWLQYAFSAALWKQLQPFSY